MGTLSTSLAFCEGKPPFTSGILSHKGPMGRSVDASFIVNHQKTVNKQSSCRWFYRQWRSHDVIVIYLWSWWRGNIFRVAGPLTITGEFPSQTPVTRSFDVSFDLRMNKQLSNQSKQRSLWRHCNDIHPCWHRNIRMDANSQTTSNLRWEYYCVKYPIVCPVMLKSCMMFICTRQSYQSTGGVT